MTSFNESPLPDDLKDVIINKLGFENQTLIQEKSIPLILEGQDVLGESSTGSGKTLAFGVGVLEHVVPKKGLQALILAPTRELAEQVKEFICQMDHKRLKIVSLYGGVAIGPQIRQLKYAEVAIATPGRLQDHLERETLSLSKVKILVLDEADRMLDMGFIESIEEIIKSCPKERQNLFFSATFTGGIEKLAKKYMVNPIKVSATKQVDPAKLKQIYYDVDMNMKFSLLLHLIKQETSQLIIVFCNTRRSTDIVVKNLLNHNIEAVALHGGLTQNKRTRTIDQFKDGKRHVLVCTDVAARGIHIDDISHIYNYEIPNDPADYVHRSGRTARAGKEGIVINLLSNRDHENFDRVLREFRNFHIKKTPVPQVEKVFVKLPEKKHQGRPGKPGGRSGHHHHRGGGDEPRQSSRRGPAWRNNSVGEDRQSFRGNSGGGSNRGRGGFNKRSNNNNNNRSSPKGRR